MKSQNQVIQVTTSDGFVFALPTVAQALELYNGISPSRRSRSNGPRIIYSDQDNERVFDALTQLSEKLRCFVAPLLEKPEGLSAGELASGRGFKEASNIGGSATAMQNFLKHRDVQYSEVFEDKTVQGERFFRIQPDVFDLVKKALGTKRVK